MKKVILLLFTAITFSAYGQTYQELSDRALVLLEQDSLQRAEEVFRQAMALEPANPHNALLFSNIGIIQQKQRNYEKAVESFTYALNIAPFAVPVLLNRATVYMELALTDKAYLDYCQVIDLEKNNAEALLMRAYIYVVRRDYKAARIDYNQLLRTDPSNYAGRLGLISLNQKEEKYNEALEILNLMLQEFPHDTTLLMMRAGIETDMKSFDAALLDLEEAIKIDPDSPYVYIHRGEVYLQQNKKALAKQDFERAISLGIPQSELREQLKRTR